MRSLPQPDRNFLNFAGLAPGITVSHSETNKQITAAGLPATKINVFIDGASFKNDILEGGVHGQDASRGNPFPQIALQEFRVITQNFKAEYQRAGSAIVTATTKSGTNDLEISGFILGQNKGLVGENPGLVRRCDEEDVCIEKPDYERFQMGLSAGGPIIRDRLHYFAAYENNIQNRAATVTLGRPEFSSQFGQYEGTFGDRNFKRHFRHLGRRCPVGGSGGRRGVLRAAMAVGLEAIAGRVVAGAWTVAGAAWLCMVRVGAGPVREGAGFVDGARPQAREL